MSDRYVEVYGSFNEKEDKWRNETEHSVVKWHLNTFVRLELLYKTCYVTLILIVNNKLLAPVDIGTLPNLVNLCVVNCSSLYLSNSSLLLLHVSQQGTYLSACLMNKDYLIY